MSFFSIRTFARVSSDIFLSEILILIIFSRDCPRAKFVAEFAQFPFLAAKNRLGEVLQFRLVALEQKTTPPTQFLGTLLEKMGMQN
jgi:hypothetical protein